MHFALGDVVAVAAGEDRGERALAGAVRAHDGMDFAGPMVRLMPLRIFLSSTPAWRFWISRMGCVHAIVFIEC